MCTDTREEQRDELIAELTDKHYEARRALLVAGDKPTATDVGTSVAVELTDDVLDQLVVLAAQDQFSAGAKLTGLVQKVLLADAEVEAIKEVEQLERQRKDSQHEAKVDRAALDRAMSQ